MKVSVRRVAPVLGFVAFSFIGGFFEYDRGSAKGAFCAESNQFRNCGYPSFGACMAAASGTGATCYQNPRFVPPHDVYRDPPRRQKKYRR